MRAALLLLILLGSCNRAPEAKRADGEAVMAAKAVADVDAAAAEASQGPKPATAAGTNPSR